MLAFFGVGQTEFLILGILCFLMFGVAAATVIMAVAIVRVAKRVPCPHCGRLNPDGVVCNWCGESIHPPTKK
jgi:hypothetical protein